MVKRCSVLSYMAFEPLDFAQESEGQSATIMMRWAIVGVVLAGCAGTGWPDLVDVRDVGNSFGAPSIDRVRDMGNPEIPVVGAIEGAESDGVATTGELLLIEGSGFGKQPTVKVGGRPAAIEGRTSDGGIVVRVPQGAAPGSLTVVVSTAKGRAERAIPMRRFALVAVGEKNHLHVLEVGKEAHPFGHPLELPDAQLVRFSWDGSAAYVVAQGATGNARVHVIDMTAPGGPRLAQTFELSERTRLAAASADNAPVLAIVGETKLFLMDIHHSKRPSRWPPIALSEPVLKAGVVGAALDPDGKLLALLTARGNQVRIFDISNPREHNLVTTVDVLPETRAPVVRDLQFSVDGETIWVVSGDNAESLASGPQPTRLTAIRLPPTPEKGPRVISVWKTMPVPGATAPLGLAVSRGQPLASGTTIRIPPEKAAVFMTGVNATLFQIRAGMRKVESILRPNMQPGMMVRADINGGGGPLFATPQVLSSVDLTPDAQTIVATGVRAVARGDDVEVSFGVVTAALWGKPSPLFVPLEPVGAEQLHPPFHLGQIRIQP